VTAATKPVAAVDARAPAGEAEAGETVYTVQRACADCGQPLPAGAAPQRRYCDRDRTRRRALTFIRKGEAILAAIEGPAR
jgi:hypothetical protein